MDGFNWVRAFNWRKLPILSATDTMKTYKLSDMIDFSPGKVIYEDFSIQNNTPLHEQISHLKEDLLQVEFPEGFLLDLGWFPSFNPQGNFQVRVVQDFDWEQPIFFAETRELEELVKTLTKAVSVYKKAHSTSLR